MQKAPGYKNQRRLPPSKTFLRMSNPRPASTSASVATTPRATIPALVASTAPTPFVVSSQTAQQTQPIQQQPPAFTGFPSEQPVAKAQGNNDTVLFATISIVLAALIVPSLVFLYLFLRKRKRTSVFRDGKI